MSHTFEAEDGRPDVPSVLGSTAGNFRNFDSSARDYVSERQGTSSEHEIWYREVIEQADEVKSKLELCCRSEGCERRRKEGV